MKKTILTIIVLSVVTVLSAHEFWLQPDKFIYESGEPMNIRFNVGENFEGENWTGDTGKIKNLNFYYSDIKDDLLPAMGTEKGDSIQFSLVDEGTAMVTYNSNNSFIQLDSGKFNGYLREDGLQDAINYRQEHHEEDSVGREYYQRSVKTILQVGEVYTNTFKLATDLPLDIVLQNNPYSFKGAYMMHAQVLFQDEPLKKTVITIWQRYNGRTIKQETLTDEAGGITFHTDVTGEWMISCVKMIPLKGQRDDEHLARKWQSYWGSCTWGFDN